MNWSLKWVSRGLTVTLGRNPLSLGWTTIILQTHLLPAPRRAFYSSHKATRCFFNFWLIRWHFWS